MTSILIVEDEFAIALNLEQKLEKAGHRVVEILDHAQAVLDYLAQGNPVDLLLMDIQLKGNITGIELAKQVWQQYQLPVIFITASLDEQTFQQALHSQPFGYLNKPFKEQDLYRSISLALQQYQQWQDNRRSLSEYQARWMSSLLQPACILNTEGWPLWLNPAFEALFDCPDAQKQQPQFRSLFAQLRQAAQGAQPAVVQQEELQIELHSLEYQQQMTELLLIQPLRPSPSSSPSLGLQDVLFIRDKGRLLSIAVADILWIESADNYSVVYTAQQKILSNTYLKYFQEQLPSQIFFRVHRSYLVNLQRIKRIEDSDLYILERPIPISKAAREELYERINIL